MATNKEYLLPHLASALNVGDVIFIRVRPKPFREVARVTRTWTNHVGVVIDLGGDEPQVAESKFPRSRVTPLSAFVRRSEHGRVAVSRLRVPLDERQREGVREAALRRVGIYYDTGFNLHSRRQFCSRYVREVLHEATGISTGEVQSFETLLRQHPGADLRFWHLWFFGRIPWSRETLSPASLLRCQELQPVFDGYATTQHHHAGGITTRRNREGTELCSSSS
jgi:hypothetical protein